MKNTILIQNGLIYDGLGGEGYEGSVLVADKPRAFHRKMEEMTILASPDKLSLIHI